MLSLASDIILELEHQKQCLTTRLTRKYPQQNYKLRLPQNHQK